LPRPLVRCGSEGVDAGRKGACAAACKCQIRQREETE
jgi:hypothetical protein